MLLMDLQWFLTASRHGTRAFIFSFQPNTAAADFLRLISPKGNELDCREPAKQAVFIFYPFDSDKRGKGGEHVEGKQHRGSVMQSKWKIHTEAINEKM